MSSRRRKNTFHLSTKRMVEPLGGVENDAHDICWGGQERIRRRSGEGERIMVEHLTECESTLEDRKRFNREK